MAMGYGAIVPTFWTGSTGRLLRSHPDAQIVALYLMTSPHANIIGIYHCPLVYVGVETGRGIEGASKGLLKLREMDFCTFDEASDTVWVHEMALYQIGERLKASDKRVKHVHSFFGKIPVPSMKWGFFEKYGAAYHLPTPTEPKPNPAQQEAPSKGLGRAFEGASATSTITTTNTSTAVPSERAPVAPPDPEKELFDRGKQVLGKSAGGQITKLLRAKGNNVALARAAIEQASTKQNPAEYIGAVVRGGTGPPAFSERHTNGFVAIMQDDFRNQQHEPDPDIIDVTPNPDR